MKSWASIAAVKIRIASTEDLTRIVDVFLACWKIAYQTVLSEKVREAMDFSAAKELWEKSFVAEGRTNFVIEVDSAIVAVFRTGIDSDNPDKWHLFSLYVHPNNAGQGLGSEILEILIKEARTKHFKAITLWVFEKNIPALNLYKKFGFTPTGRTRIRESWGELEIELIRVDI